MRVMSKTNSVIDLRDPVRTGAAKPVVTEIKLREFVAKAKSTQDETIKQSFIRVDQAEARIGEILAQLKESGVKIATQKLEGLGTIVSNSNDLASAVKQADNKIIFESVTELGFLIARKIVDFIKALKVIEPNLGYAKLLTEQGQILELGGKTLTLETPIDATHTHKLRVEDSQGLALHGKPLKQYPNVMRPGKESNGFVLGSNFEEIEITAGTEELIEGSGHWYNNEKSFNAQLGRVLSSGAIGDQVYNAKVNGKEHPSEKFGDDSRAFATRLAKSSPVESVGLSAQYLDDGLVKAFIKTNDFYGPIGGGIAPRWLPSRFTPDGQFIQVS